MGKSNTSSPGADGQGPQVDFREQLFNEQLVGPAWKTQLPSQAITRLHGLLLDLDPKLILPGNRLFPFAEDPRLFFVGIEPVLARHPLTRHAEVRMTGTGIHAIPRFDPPVEFRSAAEQQNFTSLVRAVQRSLPADFNAPGITALTRAVGSVNSKNGVTVEIIRPGEPIDPREVEAFVHQLVAAPFRTVARILLGDERAFPCPACRGEGSRLDVLDHAGKCYTRCGKVTLAQLYNCVLRPFSPANNADEQDAGEAAAPPRRVNARPSRKKGTPKLRT